MPNRARQRGDYFERRAQDALQADGWVVVRSAGSLGPADLVAMRAGEVMLISCKLSGKLPRRELIALVDVCDIAGAVPILAKRLELPGSVSGYKAGWVALDKVGRHETRRVGQLHMPARRVPSAAAAPDGLSPAGQQLTLPFG